MNINIMEKYPILKFLETNKINWCPIKLKVEDKSKKLLDEEWINKPDILTWWDVHKDKIDKRKKLLLEEELDIYNSISIDTRDVFEIDIDIKDDGWDNLSKREKDLYAELCKLPNFTSITKKYGRHVFILDIQHSKLPQTKIGYFRDYLENLSEVSDYSRYKSNLENDKKEKFKYMKDTAGWCELLKGKNSWCLLDKCQFTNNEFDSKKGLTTLEKILKTKYFKAPPQEKEEKPEKRKTSTKTKMDKKLKQEIDILSPPEKEKNNAQEIIDHLDNINMKYIDNPHAHFSLLGAVVSLKDMDLLQHFKLISSKSKWVEPNYEKWFGDKVKYFINSNYYTKGTIFYFSKMSDTNKYFKIYSEYNFGFKKNTPKFLADFIWNLNKDNILVSKINILEKSICYCFNHFSCIWSNQGVEPHNIRSMISDDIGNFCEIKKIKIRDEIKVLQEEEDNDDKTKELERLESQYEYYDKVQYGIEGPTLISNTLQMLEDKIKTKNLSKIEFDTLYDYLPFDNKLKVNVLTGEVSNINRDDYIETMFSYNYEEPCEEDYKLFVEIFEGCFMDNEYTDKELEKEHKAIMNDVIYILATGLVGRQIQSIFIMNGSGGNGKSLIMGVYKDVLDKYCFKEVGSRLEERIDVNKPSPAFADLLNKRAAIFEEFDKSKSICIDTCKILSGNPTLKARYLNKNPIEFKLLATIILCCNENPNLTGEINDAITRRFMDIYWRMTFRTEGSDKAKEHLGIYKDNKLVGYDKQRGNNKLANTTYSTDPNFKIRMRPCMLKYLLQWIQKYPTKISKNNGKFLEEDYVFSKTTQERTKNYMSAQNKFGATIEELIIPTGNKMDCIDLTTKDGLYDKYKNKELDEGTLLKNIMSKSDFKTRMTRMTPYSDCIGSTTGHRTTRFDGNKQFNKGNYLEGFYWKETYEQELDKYNSLNVIHTEPEEDETVIGSDYDTDENHENLLE